MFVYFPHVIHNSRFRHQNVVDYQSPVGREAELEAPVVCVGLPLGVRGIDMILNLTSSQSGVFGQCQMDTGLGLRLASDRWWLPKTKSELENGPLTDFMAHYRRHLVSDG